MSGTNLRHSSLCLRLLGATIQVGDAKKIEQTIQKTPKTQTQTTVAEVGAAHAPELVAAAGVAPQPGPGLQTGLMTGNDIPSAKTPVAKKKQTKVTEAAPAVPPQSAASNAAAAADIAKVSLAPEPSVETASDAASVGDIAKGAKLFKAKCAQCHTTE